MQSVLERKRAAKLLAVEQDEHSYYNTMQQKGRAVVSPAGIYSIVVASAT